MTFQPGFEYIAEPVAERKPNTMLWFDNSSETTQVKILRAAIYYEKKYNCAPTFCRVNPKCQTPTDWTQLNREGIRIVIDTTVLVNHFYIGQEESMVVVP